jgi:hypothetical protein
MPSSLAAVAWGRWVTGWAVSLGGSKANAMIRQICSGWNIDGVPGSGASHKHWATGRPSPTRLAFAPALDGRVHNAEQSGRLAHADAL